jgi:hypothetical protein
MPKSDGHKDHAIKVILLKGEEELASVPVQSLRNRF